MIFKLVLKMKRDERYSTNEDLTVSKMYQRVIKRSRATMMMLLEKRMVHGDAIKGRKEEKREKVCEKLRALEQSDIEKRGIFGSVKAGTANGDLFPGESNG